MSASICLPRDYDDKCAVCLDEISSKVSVKKMVDNCVYLDYAHNPHIFPLVLRCGHKFHDICVRPWLVEKNTCPSCRNPAIQSSLTRGKFIIGLKGDEGSCFKELHFINIAEETPIIKKLTFLASTIDGIASRILVRCSDERREELDTYLRVNGHLLIPLSFGYRTNNLKQLKDLFAMLIRDNDFSDECLATMR